MHRVVKRAAIASALMGAAFAVTAPAQAAPPEYPHGVGVCMSQVGSHPEETVGAESLGAFMRNLKGAERAEFFLSLRGDEEAGTGCGAPPGPGHFR